MDTWSHSPQDFAAWIKADPDFAVGEQRRVTIVGVEGLQIDATPTWRSTTAMKEELSRVNDQVTWNLVTSPEKWRFIMLDNVNGQRVLILMISPSDKFDDAMQKAREILDAAMLGTLCQGSRRMKSEYAGRSCLRLRFGVGSDS